MAKVISLLQPWAQLVVVGAKKIETRSWNTHYRGDILIQASASFSRYGREFAFSPVASNHLGKHRANPNGLPFGAIIGRARITGTTKTEQVSGTITKQENQFGDYTAGRYAWFMDSAVEFEHPIPAKGSLNLWEFPFTGYCSLCGVQFDKVDTFKAQVLNGSQVCEACKSKLLQSEKEVTNG